MKTTTKQTSFRLASLWPVFVGVALVAGFFIAHQALSTGFFTSDFGLTGSVLLYGTLLTGLVPATVGSMNLARKTELETMILTAVFWTVATAWFFFAFPFNFAHVTAVVPSQLSFLLSWITNDIGRALLGIALVGAAAFLPFFGFQLNSARRRTL